VACRPSVELSAELLVTAFVLVVAPDSDSLVDLPSMPASMARLSCPSTASPSANSRANSSLNARSRSGSFRALVSFSRRICRRDSWYCVAACRFGLVICLKQRSQ
jgi:hypothetical protein